MKHVALISKSSVVLASTSLEVKLDGIISIIDRLLLAQRQAAWKVPFPPDNNNDDTDTNTTS